MIKLSSILQILITEASIEQLKTQFVDSGKINQKLFAMAAEFIAA